MTVLQADIDFLEHYGKKGMQWGVRKGKAKTGVTRAQGATIDRNKRTIAKVNAARSGEKHRAAAAIGRALVGKETQSKNWNRSIKDLQAQNKRIKAGELTLNDKLAVYGGTSISGLVISRTPA